MQNSKVAQSSEQAIEEEVQFSSIELSLTLESEEKHNVLGSDLLGTFKAEDNHSKEF